MRAIFLGAAMMGMAACQAQNTAPTKEQALKDLKFAKVETWRAMYRDNDIAGLDEFLSDDFVIVVADGAVMTKPEILKDLKENPWEMPPDFLYTVTGIKFPSPTSAIVYGHGDSTRVQDGAACHHRYTSSNVFRYKAGDWHPVSSHVSDASCEPT